MRKQTQTSNIEATCRIETRLDRSGNKAVIGLERFKREEQPDEIGGVATSLKWRVPPRLRVVTSAASTEGSGTRGGSDDPGPSPWARRRRQPTPRR